jgi:hypothetical protein
MKCKIVDREPEVKEQIDEGRAENGTCGNWGYFFKSLLENQQQIDRLRVGQFKGSLREE